MAPRLIALSAMCSARPRATARIGAFAAGVMLAFAAVTATGSLAWSLLALAGKLYAGLAIAMLVAGIWTLAKPPAHDCACGPSLPAPFLLGLTSIVSASPCCLPVLFAAAAYAPVCGVLASILCAAAFGAGHCAFAVVVAAGVIRGRQVLRSATLQSAVRITSGALFLCTGAFYAVSV